MTALEILAPFLGAAAFEIVHWFDLRDKLHLEKYRRLLRSPGYWIITVLAALIGGAVALVLFADQGPRVLLVAGAAFPTLFRKLVTTFASRGTPMLGGAEQRRTSVLRDYFAVA